MYTLGNLGFTVALTGAGASGAPTSTGWYENLAWRAESYSHTITAAGGFESMTLSFACDIDEAIAWLNRLMYSVVVYDPDLWIAWEGYLASVDVTIGGERRSVSLDAMANRVNVRYTTVLGTPASTGTSANTTSAGLYGTKDTVLSLSTTTATAAQNIRAAALAAMAYPRAVPSSEISATGSGEVRVDLAFAGWYTTLDWVLTSRNDATTEATTTQVGALIGASSPGIGATNAFLSTSTASITASGVSDTRQIDADTTYRAKVEALLSQGNSSGQRLAWGVYENRVLFVDEWAGATPTTATYRRCLSDATVYGASGVSIPPWLVRPDAIMEVADMLDYADSTPVDVAARYYVERVTCDIGSDGWRLSLEPAASDALDARLARLGT